MTVSSTVYGNHNHTCSFIVEWPKVCICVYSHREFSQPGQSHKSIGGQRKRKSKEGHARLRQKKSQGAVGNDDQTKVVKENSTEHFPSTRGLVSRPVRFA